ncbi:MAG: hypothetical protein AB8H12_20755, partial [Lewinella sp.]
GVCYPFIGGEISLDAGFWQKGDHVVVKSYLPGAKGRKAGFYPGHKGIHRRCGATRRQIATPIFDPGVPAYRLTWGK